MDEGFRQTIRSFTLHWNNSYISQKHESLSGAMAIVEPILRRQEARDTLDEMSVHERALSQSTEGRFRDTDPCEEYACGLWEETRALNGVPHEEGPRATSEAVIEPSTSRPQCC